MWIKWRETRLYSVECITSHSVDPYIAFLAYFSGGLLLFLPGMRQKRAQQILAVRVMKPYGK